MVTATPPKKKQKKKRYHPGHLANAINGMFYNVVANQRQPQYTYDMMFNSVGANRGHLLFIPGIYEGDPMKRLRDTGGGHPYGRTHLR